MGVVRHGVSAALEAQADAILHEALKDLPPGQKTDVLTRWKEEDRKSREVYNATGIADPSRRSGTFGRAYNPAQTHLNSVNGGRGYHHRESDLRHRLDSAEGTHVSEPSAPMQQAFGIEV